MERFSTGTIFNMKFHKEVRRVPPLVSRDWAVLLIFSSLLLVLTPGCGLRSGRVNPPKIDPVAAGRAAVAEYDLSGDGILDQAELENAPALKSAMRNLDQDENGQIVAEEITARINAWKKTKIGMMSIACVVLMDGRPLSGATVTLEPESFLGDAVKPATGVTVNGTADMSIAEQYRPVPNLWGVHCGLYKVRISKQQGGSEVIPSKYNTESTLGCEVALDAPGTVNSIVFRLSKK